MTKSTRNLLIIILVLLAACIYLFYRNRYNEALAAQLQNNYEVSKDSLYRSTINDIQVATRREYLGAQARELLNLDSIMKAHDIRKASDVISHISSASHESVALTPTKVQVHSINGTQEDYNPITVPPDCPRYLTGTFDKGNYYHLQVRLGDSSYAHLQASDTISLTSKWVTTGNIFHRKRYPVVDVVHSNPYITTNSIQSYQFSDPISNSHDWLTSGWNLGASVGYFWTGKWRVGAGITVTKTLIRLSKQQ